MRGRLTLGRDRDRLVLDHEELEVPQVLEEPQVLAGMAQHEPPALAR